MNKEEKNINYKAWKNFVEQWCDWAWEQTDKNIIKNILKGSIASDIPIPDNVTKREVGMKYYCDVRKAFFPTEILTPWVSFEIYVHNTHYDEYTKEDFEKILGKSIIFEVPEDIKKRKVGLNFYVQVEQAHAINDLELLTQKLSAIRTTKDPDCKCWK